jgi:hypothetical protein
MKKQTKLKNARALRLNAETLRELTALSDAQLAAAPGGMMHTSFSCGRDLCTTH